MVGAEFQDREHRPDAPVVAHRRYEVGAVDDPLERAADRLADRVLADLDVAVPANGADPTTRVQPTGEWAGDAGAPSAGAGGRQRVRTGAAPPAPRASRSPTSRIQAKAIEAPIGPEGGPVGDRVQSGLERAVGTGRPLEPGVRASMERGFGTDLSGVRIHHDARADALNRSMQARAFTTGHDVFFRQGEYRPESRSGQHLIAHELAHVVQQSTAGVRRKPATIQRLFGRSKKKQQQSTPPPQIGSPQNATISGQAPNLAKMGYDQSKILQAGPQHERPAGPQNVRINMHSPDAWLAQKGYDRSKMVAAGPQNETGPPRVTKTVTAASRGFEVDRLGRLSRMAAAVTVPTGPIIALLDGSGAPLTARDADGKPIDSIVCKLGGRDVAVPNSAFASGGKGMERAGKAAGVVGFFGEMLGAGSEGTTAVNAASAKADATSSAAANPGVFSAGDAVGYDSLDSTQQAIYDNANYYNATEDAITGSAAALGDWFDMISSMKGFYDNWSSMNKKERANAVADGFASFGSTFASTSDFVAHSLISSGNAGDTRSFGMRSVKVAGTDGSLVAGSEWYQATKAEEVSISSGLIAGGVGAAKELKDAILNFVKWAKHLKKADESGNLAREGLNTVQSFGTAAKSTMNTVMKVKEFFEGSAGVAAQAMPIFGLVLNAMEIVKRGLDIYRAKKDAILVKRDKASAKSKFSQVMGGKVDHKKMTKRREDLQQQVDAGNDFSGLKAAEIAEIDEYLLDRDLAWTADKRRNRAILAIIKEAQSVAANISTLAGQAHVAAGFKISGAATGLGAKGVRNVKQFGRNRGWKGFDQNKTTEKKEARYVEIADRLYGDFITVNVRFGDHLTNTGAQHSISTSKQFDTALNAELVRHGSTRAGVALQEVQKENIRLKGRVKAAGLSWREFCAESDPTKRYQMIIEGQKKRE
jgi:hypothetical protein